LFEILAWLDFSSIRPYIGKDELTYNMELRWDGVPSLADGLRMLRDQAARTPTPQWVRIVGGWNEFQFAERRLPTLGEINAAAPDTPVFVLHLYDRALLNRAALRAVGYGKDTPEFPGGEIQRDKAGNPTGMLIARPNAAILYGTLAKGPKLPVEYQMNSTRQFMRELNRLGLTSIIGAGGMLVFSACDFEDLLEPRPDLPASLEGELKDVVTLLAANRWPFRLHATYNESIERFLNVFEDVNCEILPFKSSDLSTTNPLLSYENQSTAVRCLFVRCARPRLHPVRTRR
jgi:predicted amidohydrolase YtcJ